MNLDLINHDDEITCPNCQGIGRIKKSGELLSEGILCNICKKTKEYIFNGICFNCIQKAVDQWERLQKLKGQIYRAW